MQGCLSGYSSSASPESEPKCQAQDIAPACLALTSGDFINSSWDEADFKAQTAGACNMIHFQDQ